MTKAWRPLRNRLIWRHLFGLKYLSQVIAITSKLGESSPSLAVLGPCHDKGLTGSGGRRTATEESRRRLVRNASWLLLSELRPPSKLSSCHWSCVRRRRQRMGNLGQSTTSKQRWFHR